MKKVIPWQLESQSVDYETPWFQILKQSLTTADGKPATFYVHDAHDSVICVCLDDENKIMIEQQYRPAVKKVSVDYPAGSVEPDDASADDAIRRELLEEAGYEVKSLKRVGSLDTNPGFSSSRMHIYIARGGVTQKPKPDATESIIVSFATPSEILELISSGHMICTFCVSATFLAFTELGLLKTSVH